MGCVVGRAIGRRDGYIDGCDDGCTIDIKIGCYECTRQKKSERVCVDDRGKTLRNEYHFVSDMKISKMDLL